MVKKNAIAIVSYVIAGAIVEATYILLGNRNRGVEGSESSIQQPMATSISGNSTVVRIIGNSGSNSFSQNPIEIKVGEIVTWINNDSGRHSVTSKNGVFDSGLIGKGESISHTFDKAGHYPYFCSPHPGIVGTVVATER